jgi:hypothetical protein
MMRTNAVEPISALPTPFAGSIPGPMLDNTDATVLDIIDDFSDVIDRGAPLHLCLSDRGELAATLESEFNIDIPDTYVLNRFGTIASILSVIHELTAD